MSIQEKAAKASLLLPTRQWRMQVVLLLVYWMPNCKMDGIGMPSSKAVDPQAQKQQITFIFSSYSS